MFKRIALALVVGVLDRSGENGHAVAGTMGFGSGTTPTLMGNDYVAITDNADGKVNVVIYGQRPRADGQVVCQVGIFEPGLGATENSLSAVGNSLIAENNYGYSGPREVPRSEPGIARVDVVDRRCEIVWETGPSLRRRRSRKRPPRTG